MKYYVVKNGRQTGIFKTWDECKKQTQGFSGAVYKSFTNINEANAYLGVEDTKVDTNNVAYVDGSYNAKTHEFSYGVVMMIDEMEEHFCEKFDDPKLADMRNVSGEILGARFAMDYAINHGLTEIKIFYDYEGVKKWCTGEWKANKEGTKAYQEYYKSIKNDLTVEFVKVKSHSGDKYNDLADILAKKALGLA